MLRSITEDRSFLKKWMFFLAKAQKWQCGDFFFHLTRYRDKCTSATAHSSPETMYATPLQTGQLCSWEGSNWCVYCLLILITTGHFLIQRTAKKTKTTPIKAFLFSLLAWERLELNFNFSITVRHEAQTPTTSTCAEQKLCTVASWLRWLWNNVIGLLSVKMLKRVQQRSCQN